MKKLIVTACTIALAGVVQAASCSWGSGALRTAKDANGGWSGTAVNAAGALVTMSIYYVDYDTYTSLATASQKDLYDAYSTQAANLTGVNKNASNTIIGAITINDTDAAAGIQYAVVTATYTDATYGDMFMATRAQTTFNSATQKGSATALISGVANWQAVPEPTSGLLMLLGVAGLALKRRRA